MSTTVSPPAAPPGAVLASDAEREDTVRRLHDALGEGRLDVTEAGERSAAAYAARFRTELTPLTADLPSGAPAPVGGRHDVPSWISLREALVWRAHLVVWGPQAARPTGAQCRTATVLAVAAVVWFLLCAVLGALVVGA